jgi:hypothetical protein
VGWQRVHDRKRVRRAGQAVGAPLATLWAWQPAAPGQNVHTRAFQTQDGRTGFLYTDGHIDWDNRPLPPWFPARP